VSINPIIQSRTRLISHPYTSGILGTRKYDVSETGSVSILRCGGKTPTQLGPYTELGRPGLEAQWLRLALCKGPNCVGVFPQHLRTETGPVFETSCFLVPSSLGPVIEVSSKGPNWVGVFPPHLRTETDHVSETSCFLVPRIPDDGKSPKTQ
jgi:hypothetical protein